MHPSGNASTYHHHHSSSYHHQQSQSAPLSAAVTRILCLSGFPRTLKTRDIQAAFSQWENELGGFKIKWNDDTNLLIVFEHARTAKKAYLQAQVSPPPQLMSSPTSTDEFKLRPYDGKDAQNVIAAVNARAAAAAAAAASNSGGNGGHRASVSISGGLQSQQGNGANGAGGHARRQSSSAALASGAAASSWKANSNPLKVGGTTTQHSLKLPIIPNHPTLGSLIEKDLVAGGN